jgi:hypothetical protein
MRALGSVPDEIVRVRFEIVRRRRSLISAQGSSGASTLGLARIKNVITLKGFVNSQTLSGFSRFFDLFPGLPLVLQSRDEISKRLRR